VCSIPRTPRTRLKFDRYSQSVIWQYVRSVKSTLLDLAEPESGKCPQEAEEYGENGDDRTRLVCDRSGGGDEATPQLALSPKIGFCRTPWQQLAILQSDAEEQARQLNKVRTQYQMVLAITSLLGSFCALAIAAALIIISDRQGAPMPPVEGIGVLVFMSLLFSHIGLSALYSMTRVSSEYRKAVTTHLFDARLTPVITREFTDYTNFEVWLMSQEVSASRAFDVRITVEDVRRVVAIVVTATFASAALIVNGLATRQ